MLKGEKSDETIFGDLYGIEVFGRMGVMGRMGIMGGMGKEMTREGVCLT